jgi:K+/H+ antiporter YhaU regulatory subunit KhtT
VAVAVLRDGKPFYTPDPEFAFGPWDLVILVGDRESLDRATPLFINADTNERPLPLPGLAQGPSA